MTLTSGTRLLQICNVPEEKVLPVIIQIHTNQVKSRISLEGKGFNASFKEKLLLFPMGLLHAI